MLNHIIVMGRLTRDPELRYTQSRLPVASFTLAVDRDYTDANGTRETDFIDCVAWRNTAEFAEKYFFKGKMAVVDGRLQKRSYTDKNGNQRWITEILVNSMYFGDSKKERDEPAPASAPAGKAVDVYAGNATGYAEARGKDYSAGSMFTEINGVDDGQLPF